MTARTRVSQGKDSRDVTRISSRAVSVSHELTAIQRAVEGAALLVEVGRQGGVESEDIGALVSAILSLATCRLRDLGRAARGALPAELFWAPHNAAVADTAPGEEDIVLDAAPLPRPGRKTR